MNSQQIVRHYRHSQYGGRSENVDPVEKLQLLLQGLEEILCRCEGAVESGNTARKGELVGQAMDIFITMKQGLACPDSSSPQASQVIAMTSQFTKLYDHCLFLLSRTTLNNDLEALGAVRHVVHELDEAWRLSHTSG